MKYICVYKLSNGFIKTEEKEFDSYPPNKFKIRFYERLSHVPLKRISQDNQLDAKDVDFRLSYMTELLGKNMAFYDQS